MIEVGKHFNEQYDEYLASVFRTNRIWYTNINNVLNPYLNGDIIDVGNGGIFTYDTKKAKRIVAVDIAFRNIPKLKKYPNVIYKCDDARSLKSINPASFDVAIFQLILHHITGNSSRLTLRNMQKVMKAAMRVLKPGGTIIIIEPVVLNVVEYSEKLFYPLVVAIDDLLKMPIVYMFSRNTILRFISESGFESINYKKISYGKKIDILNGWKPSLLVVPAWLAPHRCYFFVAKKPNKYIKAL